MEGKVGEWRDWRGGFGDDGGDEVLDLVDVRLGARVVVMTEATSTDSIPKLPNDLIIEILTRLPLKSVLKFRCVCKSWLSLISCQEFIKSHLKNAKETLDLMALKIILKCRGVSKQISVRSLLFGSITDAFDAVYSVDLSRNVVRVVGSCDGLLCLLNDRKQLVLLNPSTGICKTLPDFGVKVDSGGYFAYGLGYDKSSDDYKVVGFYNSNRDLSEVIVQVYSLKCDKWRRIKNFKGRWLMDDPATFVNGKLYWIANPDHELESGWDIVSLDLESEEYEILPMPSYVKSGYYSRLGASEGFDLYLLCSHLTSADVWIMDDCGVGKGAWKKVARIPYVDDFLKYTYKRALYVLKNGQLLLLCGSTFVIFNAMKCSFRYPEIRNSTEFFAMSTYFESFVSTSRMILKGGACLSEIGDYNCWNL